MTRPTRVLPAMRALVLAACISLVMAGCNPPAPAGSATVAAVPVVLNDDRVQQVLIELDEAERSAAPTAPAVCSLDGINGSPITPGVAIAMGMPPLLELSGWVVDQASMSRPPAVVRLTQVEGGRQWEIEAGPGVSRKDVADHFKDVGVAEAGVNVTADLSLLPAGEYTLVLVHRQGDRQLTCERGARILIAG